MEIVTQNGLIEMKLQQEKASNALLAKEASRAEE